MQRLHSAKLKFLRELYCFSFANTYKTETPGVKENGHPPIPGQLRDIVPPVCPGSSCGPPTRSLEHLTREVSTHATSSGLP